MKNSIIIALLLICAIQVKAQSNTKTDSLMVEGVCEMCQERIQKFAYGKGVKFAEWDQNTSYLKLVYNEQKTTLSEISERVAGIGHKTNLHPADEKAYNKLPGCCQYESVEKH